MSTLLAPKTVQFSDVELQLIQSLLSDRLENLMEIHGYLGMSMKEKDKILAHFGVAASAFSKVVCS